MVNFRYHVVSLVAVFLALGAGIIVGSSVIDDQIVKQLRADADSFKTRNAELRADVEQLQSRLGFWDSFGRALVPQLVRGKLKGRTLVIVAQEGLDGAAIDQVSEAIVQAGAAKPARVVLTRKWMLPAGNAFGELVTATGSSLDHFDRAALLKEVGTKLGTRLGEGGDPSSGTDLLNSLSDAGFIHLADAGRGSFPTPGSLIVTLSAGDPDQAPPAQDLLVPLVEALSASRPTVVGEPLGAKDSVTDRVRGAQALAGLVPTVDHADTGPGRLSLVWALRALLDGGKAPHYGVHRGTDGVMPAIA